MVDFFSVNDAQIPYDYPERNKIATYAGEIVIEVRGQRQLEGLRDYFRKGMVKKIRRLVQKINKDFRQNREYYADVEGQITDTSLFQEYYINLLRDHQNLIVNRLNLSRKYSQMVERRFFQIENTFDEIEAIIRRDDQRTRDKVFEINVVDFATGSIDARVNNEMLLALLLRRSLNKKKVIGLHLNILLGYQEFVTSVMKTYQGRFGRRYRYRADPFNTREGKEEGLLPKMTEKRQAKLKSLAQESIFKRIKKLHTDSVREISSEIIRGIDEVLE